MSLRPLLNTTLRCSLAFNTRLRSSAVKFCAKHVAPTITSRSLHTTRVARDRSFTNLLADDDPPPVQVSSISDAGIQLADGLMIPGPSIFLEGKVFLWDVPHPDLKSRKAEERWQGWTPERFEIFEAVAPRPEMLILGTGKTLVQPPPFLSKYLTGLGIQLEVLDTRNACSTYNILSEEGRRVAAALLPFKPYAWPKSAMSKK
ncbi:hypothetical protein CPC08DRAFT_712809 [Agrocybe pediades]|nr:hypothetical protein CPC08DRAFT_712809 [Agrocybe pediades]